jgi:hypothetical protein
MGFFIGKRAKRSGRKLGVDSQFTQLTVNSSQVFIHCSLSFSSPALLQGFSRMSKRLSALSRAVPLLVQQVQSTSQAAWRFWLRAYKHLLLKIPCVTGAQGFF